MQPHSPQVPMNDVAAMAGPTNWKKGALVLFAVIAMLAVVVAFLLPPKHVEGRYAPAATGHRATSPAYNNPTR